MVISDEELNTILNQDKIICINSLTNPGSRNGSSNNKIFGSYKFEKIDTLLQVNDFKF